LVRDWCGRTIAGFATRPRPLALSGWPQRPATNIILSLAFFRPGAPLGRVLASVERTTVLARGYRRLEEHPLTVGQRDRIVPLTRAGGADVVNGSKAASGDNLVRLAVMFTARTDRTRSSVGESVALNHSSAFSGWQINANRTSHLGGYTPRFTWAQTVADRRARAKYARI
jgi:hypothetical protein